MTTNATGQLAGTVARGWARIRVAWTFLFTRRPRWYLLAYVVLILGWACLYRYWREDFYAPYSQHEPEIVRLREHADSSFEQLMLRPFGNQTSISFPDGVTCLLPTRGNLWLSPSSNEDYLTEAHFPVSVGARYPDGVYRTSMYTVVLQVYKRLFSRTKYSQPFMLARADVRPFASLEESGDTLNPELGHEEDIANAFNHSPVSHKEFDTLRDYMRQFQGEPWKLGGNFKRMLYFSSITATTVGYGDIVPLTGRARFLTATEAIIGLLLIGLCIGRMTSSDPVPAASPGASASGAAITPTPPPALD